MAPSDLWWVADDVKRDPFRRSCWPDWFTSDWLRCSWWPPIIDWLCITTSFARRSAAAQLNTICASNWCLASVLICSIWQSRAVKVESDANINMLVMSLRHCIKFTREMAKALAHYSPFSESKLVLQTQHGQKRSAVLLEEVDGPLWVVMCFFREAWFT